MAQTVLLGEPTFFSIQGGANPHTRNRWGLRKQVDGPRAKLQWQGLKSALEQHGVEVHLLVADAQCPGMVFPANAGVRLGDTFYLSNLNPARVQEQAHYRRVLEGLGISVEQLPLEIRFEGEADFIRVGDPSGNPGKGVYLFTHGEICPLHWVWRAGIPPYQWRYGFRSDRRALPMLRRWVGACEILPLELVNERYYHGDTALCPFGPNQEYLLVFLEAFSAGAQAALRSRFGDRLVALSAADAGGFAANSFQVAVDIRGERRTVLMMPDGLSQQVYTQVRCRGVVPYPVDVSEFLEKGGGAVKCMLLNLGEGFPLSRE